MGGGAQSLKRALVLIEGTIEPQKDL